MAFKKEIGKLFGILVVSVLVIILTYAEAYTQSYTYPLKISANHRHLVDQDDKPFLLWGDAAWSLIVQPSKEDALLYLKDRRQKGFNLIMVNLIDNLFCTNPPKNHYGVAPFSGRPFVSPNEEYFAHADYIIREAALREIVVLLFPLYLGYQCGEQGWCSEVRAASLSEMRAWGQYVGNRYRNFDNIVWCIGGDTDPLQVKNKVLECVKGIRETDSQHLITTHNQPETFATTPWPNESWVSINSVYSYSKTLYGMCKAAYGEAPVMPYFMLESAYENEHKSSLQRLRSQAYWPVLSGGMGHIFGNCPIWHFGSYKWCALMDWKEQLDSPGSSSMMLAKKLFASRAWHELVPDFEHTVMTSGYGTWGQTNYAAAALTSKGNTMIAYLPTSRQVTVDMSKISGAYAKAWWYNPESGLATLIGTYTNSGNRQFTPPSSGDWVLVVDDGSLNLPAPGNSIYGGIKASESLSNLRLITN